MDAMKALLVTVLRRVGWLLVFAGLAPIAVHIYDRVSTRHVVALVTSVDEYCRPGTCESCRYLRSTCQRAETDPRLAADLVRRRYARLVFQSLEGQPVAARASLSLLEAEGLQAGDRMQIRYRPDRPTVVRPMKVSTVVLAGLLVSATGIGLLVFTRNKRPAHSSGGQAPPRPRPPRNGRGISPAWNADRALRPAKGESSSRPSKPFPPRVPRVAIPTRRHSQGRNRWGF